MILTLYLIRRFLFALAIAAGFVLVLSFMFEFQQLLGRLSAHGAETDEVAKLAAMITPTRIHKMIPAIFGLAALWMSIRTGGTSEITVIRAAGIFGGAALVIPALAALCVGAALVAVGNPVGVSLAKTFEQRVNVLTGKESSVFLESGGYLWFRQVLDGQQTILRAARTDRGKTFEDLHMFIFDIDGEPSGHLFAETAELVDTIGSVTAESLFGFGASADIPGMCLYNLKIWDLTQQDARQDSPTGVSPVGCFETKLTAKQISDSFDPPPLVSIWRLPAQIRQLELSGFSAAAHRMHLHTELAKPLLFAAMVLIGGGFTLRHSRAINTAAAALVAALCIVAVIFVMEFARIMGEVETIHYILAAWTPPAAAMLMAAALLSFQENR